MGLETATTIPELNALWPLGTDPKAQGDDHLRLIKSVMQSDAFSQSDDNTITGDNTYSGEQTIDGNAIFNGDATFNGNIIGITSSPKQNLIVNGGHTINQYGGSGSGIGFMTDRWYTTNSGMSWTRQSLSNNNNSSGYTLSINNGSGTPMTCRYGIELPNTGFAGQFQSGNKYTLTVFWTANAGATLTPNLAFSDTLSARGTTWQRNDPPADSTGGYNRSEFVFECNQTPDPSSTILMVDLNFSTPTASFNVWFTGVKLEDGEEYTGDAELTKAEQASICQRYYSRFQGNITLAVRTDGSTGRCTTIMLYNVYVA